MLELANRATLVLTLALTMGGCELLPGLLASPGGGGEPLPEATSAALTVTVERAEGTLAGRELDAQNLDPSGFRSGLDLSFALVAQHGASLHVELSGGVDSTQNPYTGSPASAPDGGAEHPVPDSGGARVLACTAERDCRQADDFGIEISQLAEGRSVVVDGAWSGGDRVHLELRYRELR